MATLANDYRIVTLLDLRKRNEFAAGEPNNKRRHLQRALLGHSGLAQINRNISRDIVQITSGAWLTASSLALWPRYQCFTAVVCEENLRTVVCGVGVSPNPISQHPASRTKQEGCAVLLFELQSSDMKVGWVSPRVETSPPAVVGLLNGADNPHIMNQQGERGELGLDRLVL